MPVYRKRRVCPRIAVEHLWDTYDRRLARTGERLVLRLETTAGVGYFGCGAAWRVEVATGFKTYYLPGPEGDGCFGGRQGPASQEYSRMHRSLVCGLSNLGQLDSWFRWEGLSGMVESRCWFRFYSVPREHVYAGRHQCVFRKSKATLVAKVNPKHKRVTIQEAA